MQTWPYFRSRKSRSAIKSGQPVPVASCWNGVGEHLLPQKSCGQLVIIADLNSVSIDSQPFYDNATRPLKFRGIVDSLAEYHIEGSECCLIHIDNPQASRRGVWLNPQVRVGYSSVAYDAAQLWQSGMGFQDLRMLWGLWENRLRRWFTTPRLEALVVGRRMASWRAKNPSIYEPGRICLVNEMQVLAENGWAHV